MYIVLHVQTIIFWINVLQQNGLIWAKREILQATEQSNELLIPEPVKRKHFVYTNIENSQPQFPNNRIMYNMQRS